MILDLSGTLRGWMLFKFQPVPNLLALTHGVFTAEDLSGPLLDTSHRTPPSLAHAIQRPLKSITAGHMWRLW